MKKVLIIQPIAQEGIDMLLNAGCTVKHLDDSNPDTILSEVGDADAILVRNAAIPSTVIEKGANLKVISRHGAGLESIDIEAATEHGVYVTNTPIANSVSVAEHVIGMMLCLSQKLLTFDSELRNGNFNIREQSKTYELQGRTLGIVGLGNVGSRLAKKALFGLGMRVIGYDPFVGKESLEPGIELTEDSESIFQQSDFVSLNLPLNEDTKASVGMTQFKMMKTSAVIINCARGAIVREPELVDALNQGVIAGAGIDVFEPYFPRKDHPLFSMNNVILTPHSSAFTQEALVNMATQSAQGIIEVLSGKRPTWAANRIN